ncbi:MAG: hypothetical protein EP329_20360 [Deltaproteobacteria bacterium]|nr:MAG: hypothetical protein EP329_20360 [Deltaproteobacteria bacterium]
MRHVALACLVALLALGGAGCKGGSDPPRVGGSDVTQAPVDTAAQAAAPDADSAVKVATWRRVAPAGAGFSVEFPGAPEHETETVTSAAGVEAALDQYTVVDELTGRMVMVSYNPLVGQLVDFGDPDAALASLVADQKAGPRREVLSERAVVQDGYKGHELVMTSEDFGTTRMRVTWRVFIVGYRLYQLLATADDEAGQARVDRFLGSFRFTDAAAGPEAEAAKKDLWRSHDATDGSFRAALPGAPTVEVVPLETAWGRREARTLTTLSAFPPAIYTIAVIPLEQAERERPLPKLLAAWEAFTLRGRGDVTLDLRQRAAVVVAGHTARVLEVTARRADGEVAARFMGLPYGDRFYELGFLPLDARAGSTEASRFFDGFAPRPAAAGAEPE